MRKKALITGASRGIGAAAARALAQDGYDLFLVCKSSKEALERVRQELTQQYGICCETALCDVSNAREVETMIKNAGEIHVLVNNAAVSYVGLLTDMSLREWHQVMDTNGRYGLSDAKRYSQNMFMGKRIVIRFVYTGPSIEAILDKFPTAKIVRRDEEGVELTTSVEYSRGTIMELLSQGSWIRVLKPDNVVKDIQNELRVMKSYYTGE